MITKLGFGPVSQTPVDLLAVVLDDEKTLYEIDDVQVAAHVQRAAASFRDKTLKREYYVTLEGSKAARALVVYWSPQLKSWNLWETVKTVVARAIRLARDSGFRAWPSSSTTRTRPPSWARRWRARSSAPTPSIGIGWRRSASSRRSSRSRSWFIPTIRPTPRPARRATPGFRRT